MKESGNGYGRELMLAGSECPPYLGSHEVFSRSEPHSATVL